MNYDEFCGSREDHKDSVDQNAATHSVHPRCTEFITVHQNSSYLLGNVLEIGFLCISRLTDNRSYRDGTNKIPTR